jgi:hypothetical protein
MALQKEIWQADIVETLWKDNQFATRAFNSDQYVLAGKVVHIPYAGAAAVVKKNLTTFPQVAVKRDDNEATYAIDTYYAIPHFVENLEKYELSYDKRMSVVGEDTANLVQEAMNGLLYNWGPAAANVIETVGADSALDRIDGTATGTRKLFTKAVISTAVKKLRKANLGNTRITALLTSEHYNQFFESLTEGERTGFSNAANVKEGTAGRYMGVDIIERSSVLRYRKVSTVWTKVDEQSDSFAAGTGDSAASIIYSEPCVERALGSVDVFDDTGNPLYYGDVFSATLRLGGRIRRTSGIYAFVEAIGA